MESCSEIFDFGVVEKMEARRMTSTSDSDIPRMGPDEVWKKALEGFFVRVTVINEYVKDARASAPPPNSKFKEADFYKDIPIKPADSHRNHEPKDKGRDTKNREPPY